jgi:hypothetical protein
MKVVINFTLCSMLVLCLLVISGCGEGGSQEVDPTKPIGQVQAEAENMSAGALRTMAMKYKEAIVERKGHIEQVMAKLKEIPAAQQMEEVAMDLKSDLRNLERLVAALKERFDVYYEKLKAAGGDLSGLEI